MATGEWIVVMAAWTLLVALVTATVVSDREGNRHWSWYCEKRREMDASCERFRLALDAFEKDLGPVSFHMIFGGMIFMTWQRGDCYIDLTWWPDRQGHDPVTACLRIDQLKQEFTVDDDLTHVLTVMRRWAAEHGMLLTKLADRDVC